MIFLRCFALGQAPSDAGIAARRDLNTSLFFGQPLSGKFTHLRATSENASQLPPHLGRSDHGMHGRYRIGIAGRRAAYTPVQEGKVSLATRHAAPFRWFSDNALRFDDCAPGAHHGRPGCDEAKGE